MPRIPNIRIPRPGLAAIPFGIVAYVACVAFLTPAGTLGSISGATDEPTTYRGIGELISSGSVEKAYWHDFEFTILTKDGRSRTIDTPVNSVLDDTFKALDAAGVDVVFGSPTGDSAASPGPARRLAASFGEFVRNVMFVFPLILVLALLAVVRGSVPGAGGGAWPRIVKEEKTRFSDVAGLGEARYELEEIREFLTNDEAFRKVSARSPRGVLMEGPPGVGKTLMARALAGECGASFISVAGSDFTSMFVGQGRTRIKNLFETARRNAPCVVFIDEIDALARRRSGDGSSVGREKDLLVNQLLIQMDGFEDREGVVVVGATNLVEVLDPAILRPGRFDRRIHVGLPDRAGREAILRIHAATRPLDDAVDLSRVSRGTPGFSGADLANVVNEAAVLAARRGDDLLRASDFEEARDKVVMGVERRSLVLDEAERRTTAIHEAGHAAVACLLPASDPVHQASIVPRGRSLGAVMRMPERDRVCVPRETVQADLVVAMAGRAAEATFLGAENVTTGAASDIEQATDLATRMTCEWGMSTLGMVRVRHRSDGTLPDDAQAEVRRMVEDAYSRALTLVATHRGVVEALSERLLDRETMTGDEVRAIVDSTMTPPAALAAE